MLKNSIIAGLALANLVLIAAAAYMWIHWRPGSNPRILSIKSPQADPLDAPAQEFTFKPGDHLGLDAAPQIAGRALSIAATFESQQQEGVIIAQGGTAHGYTLYLQDGEVFFALRRYNVLTTLSGGKINSGRHTVIATLTRTGDLGVSLDGRPPATAKAAGAIPLRPADGLDVGIDRGAFVGPYTTPYPFQGTIEVVTLKTAP